MRDGDEKPPCDCLPYTGEDDHLPHVSTSRDKRIVTKTFIVVSIFLLPSS